MSSQSPSLMAPLCHGKSLHVKATSDDKKVSLREDVLLCHIPGRKHKSSTSMTLKAVGDIQTPSECLQRAGMCVLRVHHQSSCSSPHTTWFVLPQLWNLRSILGPWEDTFSTRHDPEQTRTVLLIRKTAPFRSPVNGLLQSRPLPWAVGN